ncbi:DUF4158 domain-containing protein [Nonomuraea sp. NPDC049504]|uniref:DUF4158 domain-containing protein n=1 Tax=Nonomuraea sp. NPDC049504 TaxID=3154729 RepID=UPI00343037C9
MLAGHETPLDAHRRLLPEDVVEHVAEQVRVPASEFGFYEWSGFTIEYHRHRVSTHVGFRTCTTELAVWPAEEVAHAGDGSDYT